MLLKDDRAAMAGCWTHLVSLFIIGFKRVLMPFLALSAKVSSKRTAFQLPLVQLVLCWTNLNAIYGNEHGWLCNCSFLASRRRGKATHLLSTTFIWLYLWFREAYSAVAIWELEALINFVAMVQAISFDRKYLRDRIKVKACQSRARRTASK